MKQERKERIEYEKRKLQRRKGTREGRKIKEKGEKEE